MKRRRLFQLLSRGKIAARYGEKGRNGKAKREIQLESLPAKLQELYLARSIQDGRDGENKSGTTGEAGGMSIVTSPAGPALLGATEEDLDEPNRITEALLTIPTGKGRAAAVEAVSRDFGVTVRTVRNWIRDCRQNGV
ncbi:MAG: hypothetical protein HYV04_07345, partial [Deltaproteobacteria bacterium]|nr:hypothetical protein [Deltaproteobacteria bacterium]